MEVTNGGRNGGDVIPGATPAASAASTTPCASGHTAAAAPPPRTTRSSGPPSREQGVTVKETDLPRPVSLKIDAAFNERNPKATGTIEVTQGGPLFYFIEKDGHNTTSTSVFFTAYRNGKPLDHHFEVAPILR